LVFRLKDFFFFHFKIEVRATSRNASTTHPLSNMTGLVCMCRGH
jgi:hypothetical protein